MPTQLRPVASEILRRIMELLCIAGGEILKFNLSAGGTGLQRTYRTAAPLKFFKKQLKIFIYNRRLK
nr:hypothetical protein [uncultured Campylobacter sp.]